MYNLEIEGHNTSIVYSIVLQDFLHLKISQVTRDDLVVVLPANLDQLPSTRTFFLPSPSSRIPVADLTKLLAVRSACGGVCCAVHAGWGQRFAFAS